MKLRVVVLAAAVVFGFGQTAVAGPIGGSPPEFLVQTDSDVPDSDASETPTLTPNGDGTFAASFTETVAGAYSIVFEFTLDPDPAISGKFTLTSLSGSTQIFSISATMSGLQAINGGTLVGGSFGETKYDDASLNGTLGLGSNGSDPFFRAEIDGNLVSALGSFSFFELTSQPPGVIGTYSQELFGAPIPSQIGPNLMSSIGVEFPGIVLTAGDRVEVPFEFVVVPETSLMALFLMSLALILRRFAREIAVLR